MSVDDDEAVQPVQPAPGDVPSTTATTPVSMNVLSPSANGGESKAGMGGSGPMRRLIMLLVVLLPCVACDQVTKVLAVDHLRGHRPLNYFDGLFRLTYAENPGAFLGLGKSLPDNVRLGLFSVVVGLVLLAACVWMIRKEMPRAAFFGLALLVAGGVGNLIDRVARDGHRVVDFAQLRAPDPVAFLQTGIFNVADVHIVVGALLMVVPLGRRKEDPEPSPPPPEAAAAA